MADENLTTGIGFDVDQSSVNAVKKASADVQASVEGISAGFSRLGPVAQAGVRSVELGFDNLKGSAEDLRADFDRAGDAGETAMRRVRTEAERTDASLTDLDQRLKVLDDQFDVLSRNVGFAGDIQSNLGAARGLAGIAGATGAAGAIGTAGELAALIEELPRLKFALQNLPDVVKAAAVSLGPAGIGLGVALVGIALLAQRASEQFNQQKARQEAVLAGTRQYFELIQDGTTASIRAAQQVVQAQLDVERIVLAQAQQTVSDINQPLNTIPALLAGGVQIAVRQFDGTLKAAETQVQQSSATITQLEATLQVYNEALQSNEVALNDAAEAARKAAEANISALSEESEWRLRVANLIRGESSEAARDLLDQNNDRIGVLADEAQALGQLLTASEAGSEEQKTYAARLSEVIAETTRLSNQNAQLRDEIIPTIDAMKQLGGAINSDFARELAEAEKDRQQEILSITQQYGDDRLQLIAEQNQELIDFDADYGQKRLDNLRKFYEGEAQRQRDFLRRQESEARDLERDLAKADSDAAKDLQKLNDDYFQDEEDRLTRHQQRLADIQQNAQYELQDALSAGDRTAAIRAIRNAERQTQQAQTEFDRETQQRQTEYQRRLSDLQQSLADERAELIAAFQQKQQDDRDQFAYEAQQRASEFQRRQQEEFNDYAQRRQALITAQQDQLSALKASFQQQLSALQGFNTQRTGMAKQAELAVVDSEKKIRDARLATARQAAGFGGRAIPAYATGGTPPLNTPVLVGERGPELAVFRSPATIYPNSRMATASGGGMSLNFDFQFNVSGSMDSAAADAIVQRAVDATTSAVRRVLAAGA